jgi:hypothetical protein
MSRGLQYLRQHSQQSQQQQARQGQQAQQDHSEFPPPAGSSQGAAQHASSSPQAAPGAGGGGIKAQGRRVAGLMLNRMNLAGKVLAQHYQQAKQQAQQGSGPSPRRMHSE